MDWTIVAWIAGLLFVYIFGLVEGRGKGYKKRKAEEEQEKKNQPPPAPETVTVDDPGLLRIKNQDGAFTLDLDGARANPVALTPNQRKRLIEILNVMRPWLEGRSAPAPASNTSQPPPPLKSGLTPAVTPSLNADQTPAQPTSLPNASPPSQLTPQPAAPKPAVIPTEDRPSAPANSIVSQIDSILQTRLTGTLLEERGIFLTQSPEGGVIVYVGLTRYNGIDEVPDPDIKAAIRAAITEWENKYTPGL
jgi:cell division protein FtsN